MTDTMLQELGRPFAPNSLRFKVQATWPKDDPRNGLIVPYIDARTVSARLNHVCGGEWATRFEPWGEPREGNAAVCHLTIADRTRSDVGKGGGFEKEKSAFSDALKRAAVHFGVGAYIYSLQAVTLKGTAEGEMRGDTPTLRIKTAGNKKTLELTPQVEAWLRSNYARWLKSDRNTWGEELDHGDEPEALGDPIEHEPIEEPTEEELALVEARKVATSAFAERGNGKVAARTKFEAQLKTAKTVGEVEALVASLEPADVKAPE